MENAFARSTAEILKHFAVTEQKGLSEAQVQQSTEKYGKNGTRKYERPHSSPKPRIVIVPQSKGYKMY
jgi:magnesium-transporting ATPase (P-type)